jgi:hypothetical protein
MTDLPRGQGHDNSSYHDLGKSDFAAPPPHNLNQKKMTGSLAIGKMFLILEE